MSRPKAIAAVAWLSRRAKAQRGGQTCQPETLDRSAQGSLALWRDVYLDSLRARNYSENTVLDRAHSIRLFLSWTAERDLTRASQITQPILENFQRWLWCYTKPNGQRLGRSTQRGRLTTLEDWFRWLTRQNVILHKLLEGSASEALSGHAHPDLVPDRLRPSLQSRCRLAHGWPAG